jgi:hypothetical protein
MVYNTRNYGGFGLLIKPKNPVILTNRLSGTTHNLKWRLNLKQWLYPIKWPELFKNCPCYIDIHQTFPNLYFVCMWFI